jgi:hypothetical protein
MTSSRYIISMTFNGIFFTDDEWSYFTQEISKGCKFKIKCKGDHIKFRKEHKLPQFCTRYYIDDEYHHYHISNDTRRQIHRYIFGT